MSNIERFINSQQAFNNQRASLESAYNNLGVEKQIYGAKKQALESAQNLSEQLLGQERTEFILGATPTLYKTAKVGLRLARDPQGTATAIRGQVEKGARDLFKKTTGRDLPQSVDEARQQVGEEAQRTLARVNPLQQVPPTQEETRVGGIVDEARRTAGLPTRGEDLGDVDDDLRFGLDRPTTIADRVADTRPPLAPPRDLPEPESVDFRTFQAPTREEGMRQVRAENERLAEQERVERIRNIDPADLRPVEPRVAPQSLGDRITNLEGHQLLKPTETRIADPIQDIEPSEIGLQLPRATAEDIASVPPPQLGRIPVSQAQRQVFGERDFPPPPRPQPQVEQSIEEQGGLRGDSTIARALGNNREQTLRPEDLRIQEVSEQEEERRPQILQEQQQAQARPQADIEREFPSPPSQPQAEQSVEGESPTDAQLRQRLDRLKAGDTPQVEAPKPPTATADIEGAVESGAEKTIAKTGAELGAEAGLGLELPGIGELIMAGTLIGGLIGASKEAKEEREQTAGQPPKQQQAPAPQQQAPQPIFDVAPTLDTSSYHNA